MPSLPRDGSIFYHWVKLSSLIKIETYSASMTCLVVLCFATPRLTISRSEILLVLSLEGDSGEDQQLLCRHGTVR